MTVCGECDTLITTRKPAIFCSGLCKKHFHISCIYSGPADLQAVLKAVTGLYWKCTECTNIQIDNEKLIEIIEQKIATSLTQFTKQFEQVKKDLMQKIADQNIPTTVEQPLKYSEVVRNKTNPGVIIKPKNQEQQNSQTRSDLMQQINPLETSLQISKVKNVKGGGILIG